MHFLCYLYTYSRYFEDEQLANASVNPIYLVPGHWWIVTTCLLRWLHQFLQYFCFDTRSNGLGSDKLDSHRGLNMFEKAFDGQALHNSNNFNKKGKLNLANS